MAGGCRGTGKSRRDPVPLSWLARALRQRDRSPGPRRIRPAPTVCLSPRGRSLPELHRPAEPAAPASRLRADSLLHRGPRWPPTARKGRDSPLNQTRKSSQFSHKLPVDFHTSYSYSVRSCACYVLLTQGAYATRTSISTPKSATANTWATRPAANAPSPYATRVSVSGNEPRVTRPRDDEGCGREKG